MGLSAVVAMGLACKNYEVSSEMKLDGGVKLSQPSNMLDLTEHFERKSKYPKA